jgi:hypothetical protein
MYRFPRIPLKTLSLAQGQQEPREMAIKMQKKRTPLINKHWREGEGRRTALIDNVRFQC